MPLVPSLDSLRSLSLTRLELLCAVLCLFAVVFGVYARFRGLGLWSLAVDEYYLARSVELIRQHGLPLYPDGGMYPRGLLFQYAMALSTALLGFGEFALRLPAVLANLAAIPPLYWLVRTRLGRAAALLVVALFSLSLWEVEFARFARMYAVYQCIFLWFVWFFYRGFILGESKAIAWAYGIAVVGVFIHEGAIFMSLLLFVPLFLRQTGKASQIRYGLRAGAVFLLNVVVNKLWAWLSFGISADRYPPGHEPVFQGMLIPPDVSLWSAVSQPASLFHSGWTLAYYLLVIAAVVLMRRVITFAPWDWRQKLVALLLVTASLFQLFGLALMLLLLAFLVRQFTVTEFVRGTYERRIGVFLLVALGFWLLVSWQVVNGQLPVTGDVDRSLHKMAAILLHYPRLLEKVVYPLAGVMPYLLAGSSIAGLVVLAGPRKQQGDEEPRFVLLILVCCLLFLGLFNTLYNSTRYAFFLFPLVLVLWFDAFAIMADWLSGRGRSRAIAVLFPFILLLASNDYSYAHLRNVDSAAVNFRLRVPEETANHYYPRFDYRGAADYVNAHWQPGEPIINAAPPTSLYLTAPNAIYYSMGSGMFDAYARKQGREDRWGLPLVYDQATVTAWVRSAGPGVWILVRQANRRQLTDWVRQAFPGRELQIESTTPGADGRIIVVHASLKQVRKGVAQ